MAKIFYLISIILFVFACGHSGENTPDNVEDSNAFYESDTLCDCKELVFDIPYNNFYTETPREGYSGVCEEYYSNGQLSLQKNFKKGKLHGALKSYYKNGQLKEDKTFDMNFQVGDAYVYDEEGGLVFHGRFRFGRQTETVFQK